VAPEQPAVDPSVQGVSRRRVLKQIGAGAAVAWSAPILTSLRAPAYAQGSPRCVPFDLCGGNPDFCGPDSACGPLPPGCGGAGCSVLRDNSCICWDVAYHCDPDGSTCMSDADCQPGLRCGFMGDQTCVCPNPGDNSACFHPCGSNAPFNAPKGTRIARPR
jgi:hypothetical protein